MRLFHEAFERSSRFTKTLLDRKRPGWEAGIPLLMANIRAGRAPPWRD
jgi:hypothetical protein